LPKATVSGAAPDISQLIRVVQIENVRASRAMMRTSISSLDEFGVIEGKIGQSAHVVQKAENGKFTIRIDFSFGAHAEDDKEAKNNM
jgi:hypothetical protein